jgi:hypothetical protein
LKLMARSADLSPLGDLGRFGSRHQGQPSKSGPNIADLCYAQSRS